MKKQTIKLNESQLRQIIRESLSELILNHTQKKVNESKIHNTIKESIKGSHLRNV